MESRTPVGQSPALSALSLPFGRVGDVGITNIAAQKGWKRRSLAKLLDSPSAVLTGAFHSSDTRKKACAGMSDHSHSPSHSPAGRTEGTALHAE